jgi:hypothetical protein
LRPSCLPTSLLTLTPLQVQANVGLLHKAIDVALSLNNFRVRECHGTEHAGGIKEEQENPSLLVMHGDQDKLSVTVDVMYAPFNS